MPKETQNSVRVHKRVSTTAPLALVFAFLAIILTPLLYSQSTHAVGQSYGFGTGDDVVNGTIVSVNQDDPDSVQRGNVNNADYVVGVVVDQASSSIVFDSNDSVYVATKGTVQAFVSTIGGDIAKGDLIVVSTVDGVGRKSQDTADGQKIVGVAQADFNENTPTAERVTLENAGDVSVGLIDVEVLVSEPTASNANNDDVNVLVKVGRRIAGKPVSLSQVVITASVVIVAFVISGTLLFGAVKGSFTSIGRNPLSANAIYHGMIRASMVSLSVMMLGIVGGYVVLIL